MDEGGIDWASADLPHQWPWPAIPGVSLRDPASTMRRESLFFWLVGSDGDLITSLQESGDSRQIILPILTLARTLAMTGAVGLFMAHSHPSGDPRPSRADVEGTRRVWRLARAMGVSLQDHVILGRQRVFSFRANGLL